jgi:ATP-dependent exoDNAse (exonuclease V) beta subunit
MVEGETQPDEVLYSHGNANWINTIAAAKSPTASQHQQHIEIKLALTSNDLSSRGAVVAAASKLAGEKLAGDLQLNLPDLHARDRGYAIHALFEQVEWLEEFRANEDELLQIVKAKVPRRDDAWAREQVRLFLKAINQPAIKVALCRGDREPHTVQLHREYPFARIVHGGIQTGFIDRLAVETDNSGVARSATVIDFKSDAIDAANAAMHAQKYRPQMATYRDAVAEMLGIGAGDVRLRLLYIAVGVDVDL